jgi:hypothetical protein
VPTRVIPAGPVREGSGSGSSARRPPPAGTVASGRRSVPRREGSAPSNVIVDPQALRAESKVGAPSSSKAALLAIAILLLGGTGAWFLMSSPADSAPAPAPVVEAQEPSATEAAPTAPLERAQPSEIEVHFESDPPGAGIYDGAVQIGTTPADLRVARDTLLRLTFRLAGHDPVERQLDFSRMAGDRTQVNVSLPKKETVRRTSAPAPSRPRPTPADDDAIPVFE